MISPFQKNTLLFATKLLWNCPHFNLCRSYRMNLSVLSQQTIMGRFEQDQQSIGFPHHYEGSFKGARLKKQEIWRMLVTDFPESKRTECVSPIRGSLKNDRRLSLRVYFWELMVLGITTCQTIFTIHHMPYQIMLICFIQGARSLCIKVPRAKNFLLSRIKWKLSFI